MCRIELQHAPGLGGFGRVGALADDALHLEGDGTVRRNRGRGITQAGGNAHVGNPLPQGLLEVADESLVLVRGLLGLLLLVLGGEVEVGCGDVGQRQVALVRALVLGITGDGPRPWPRHIP